VSGDVMHKVSEIKILKKLLIVITLPHQQLNSSGLTFSFFNCNTLVFSEIYCF